jgi:hypothetical protein
MSIPIHRSRFCQVLFVKTCFKIVVTFGVQLVSFGSESWGVWKEGLPGTMGRDPQRPLKLRVINSERFLEMSEEEVWGILADLISKRKKVVLDAQEKSAHTRKAAFFRLMDRS